LRLASVHNLRFIQRLMAEIRSAISEERFEKFRESFWSRYVPTDEAIRGEQKRKWLQARGV